MNFGLFLERLYKCFWDLLASFCLTIATSPTHLNHINKPKTNFSLRGLLLTLYWLLCSPSWSPSPWAGLRRPKRCWTAAPTTRCWYSLWRTATSAWTRSTCSSVRRSGWVTHVARMCWTHCRNPQEKGGSVDHNGVWWPTDQDRYWYFMTKCL